MKNYTHIAGQADQITENCLTQISKGNMGVFKDKMYPIIFLEIFKDLMKEN